VQKQKFKKNNKKKQKKRKKKERKPYISNISATKSKESSIKPNIRTIKAINRIAMQQHLDWITYLTKAIYPYIYQ